MVVQQVIANLKMKRLRTQIITEVKGGVIAVITQLESGGHPMIYFTWNILPLLLTRLYLRSNT